MAKVKITVLRRMYNKDFGDEYCRSEPSICDRFTDGQEFVVEGLDQPAGFCGWAWDDIHKVVLSLRSGANFSAWMKADNTNIACCTDGIRPVVFKIERLVD